MVRKSYISIFLCSLSILSAQNKNIDLSSYRNNHNHDIALIPRGPILPRVYGRFFFDDSFRNYDWMVYYVKKTFTCRAASFFPRERLFRQIYGKPLADYQIEFSRSIGSGVDLWLNLDFFHRHGSIANYGTTTFSLLSLSFGPKCVFCLSEKLQWYYGVGAQVSRSRIINKLCCTNKQKKFVYGAVFKSGFNISLGTYLFLDIFVDYVYQPAFRHHSIDIGGFKVGLGLGTLF